MISKKISRLSISTQCQRNSPSQSPRFARSNIDSISGTIKVPEGAYLLSETFKIFCLLLRHCVLHNHGIIIFRPHGFVLVQHFELLHFVVGQFKIKNIHILLHAFLMHTLRNYNNSTLNVLPKSNLCWCFPMCICNLLYNGIFEDFFQTVLGKRSPRLVLDVVLHHPLVQIILLPK